MAHHHSFRKTLSGLFKRDVSPVGVATAPLDDRSFRKTLSGLFKRDGSTVHTPRRNLERARKCMEHSQRMASSTTYKPLQFNHGQCEYLANKLKVAVHSAEAFGLFCSSEFPAECAEVMKLLCRSAEEVESFIRGCRKANWIQAAMSLINVSEHLSSLSYNLELCMRLLPNKSKLGATWLALAEMEVLSKSDLLKERISRDRSSLLARLDTVNNSSNSSDHDRQLAKCLSRRLSQQLSGTFLLSVWEIHFSDLKPVQTVGSGSGGPVRNSIWLGKEVAEKMYYGPDHPMFKNEVEILAGLSHPNIVPLLGYAMDKSKCSIVMELMDGDLLLLMEERLRQDDTCTAPFTISEAVDVILQTAEGMLYLHENKVVHRDLKSQNILFKIRRDIDSEHIYFKVADFGLSKTKERSASSNLTSNTGTTRWMAPELMTLGNDELCARTSLSELKYPFKVDLYSFGMVCYEILTGLVPFSAISSHSELKKMVLQGDRPELPDECPHVLKILIRSCWNSEASCRPSFAEICKTLRCLKYLLMTGSGGTIYADQIGSDPAVFEAIGVLTYNFMVMEPINESKSMFRVNMGDGFYAVKKMEDLWEKSEEQKFQAQVLRISNLGHTNVMKILGYCLLCEQIKVVAYEYAVLGSLHDILHGKGASDERYQNAPVLTWMQRVKIAVGVARGLHSLHTQNPPIIHGNIKASNILIFDDDVAKIGNFIPPKLSHYKYCRQERDTYGFGLLLLELLTGKQMDNNDLLESILRELTNHKIYHSVVDHRLSSNYPVEGAAKMGDVAALCVRFESGRYCPSLKDLINVLEGCY